jgi:hypothetical protein
MGPAIAAQCTNDQGKFWENIKYYIQIKSQLILVGLVKIT